MFLLGVGSLCVAPKEACDECTVDDLFVEVLRRIAEMHDSLRYMSGLA